MATAFPLPSTDERVEKTFNLEQLQSRYLDFTDRVIAECSFATDYVGGQPGGPDGVRAFVTHHLKLSGDEAEQAIKRILNEEIGERDVVPPEGGELKERLTYAVNVVRRDEFGPWIGGWQIKACLKQAASRLRVFVERRGAKGDMSEMGWVRAYGLSALNPEHPERIYVLDAKQDKPSDTFFEKIMGRVQTPDGAKSIVGDAEQIPAGARFQFAFNYMPGNVKPEDIPDIFASMMICGLGSARSLQRGQFVIHSLRYLKPIAPRSRSESKPKKAERG